MFLPVYLYLVCFINNSLFSSFKYTRLVEGNLSAHILKTKKNRVKLELGLGNCIADREDALSMAVRTGALAVVNGGFFKRNGKFNGYPENLIQEDGFIIVDPMFNRGCLGWSNNELAPRVAKLQTSCTVKLNDYEVKIDRLNMPQNGREAILYTADFGETTKSFFKSCVEITIEKVGVGVAGEYWFKVISWGKGNSRIPPNGFVLSMPVSEQVVLLNGHPDIKVKINYSYLPNIEENEFWEKSENIMQGTPSLIINGQITSPEDMAAELSSGLRLEQFPDTVAADWHDSEQRDWLINGKHPRTAVGYTKRGALIFVVVDGRQEQYPGVTLPELALLMAQLGCVGAINLGGGGDSVMVIDGVVKNAPSGPSISECRREIRPTSNAFCIY